MDNVIIAMAIILGFILLFGLYKLATSNLHENPLLKTNTPSANRRQTLKTFLAIFFTILIFIALFVTWEIFTSQ